MNIREKITQACALLDPRKLSNPMDLHDAFYFGGLLLVTVGIMQIYAPAAWIVPGAVFMKLGASR